MRLCCMVKRQTYCLSPFFTFQSLGCILFALCFFKSPYDIVYERGDSVNLAVVSGRVDIPEESPFSEVSLVLTMS